MNIEQMRKIVNNAPDGERYFNRPILGGMDSVIHNLDDSRTIIAQHEEIEQLRKSILQLIEAGDGLIENNGHLSAAYHQAKSGWYRAKHTSLTREQSK